jgi:hypothetical protein
MKKNLLNFKIQESTQYTLKIQKTKPSEGYHIWHSENNNIHNCNRVFAFTLYLNDVELKVEKQNFYIKNVGLNLYKIDLYYGQQL